MQLFFSRYFDNGMPTHFVEKIWAGFSLNDFLWNEYEGMWCTETYKENWPYEDDWWAPFMAHKPKLHTIRSDKSDRWKAGKPIHFFQWIGRPFRSKIYHFAPVIPCISVQKIKIECPSEYVNDQKVYVDDRLLTIKEIRRLAWNDGFNTSMQFLLWFNQNFEGKVIHWTDLKY